MEGLDSNILSASGISHLVVRSKNTHQIENDTDTVSCVHQSLGACHGKEKNHNCFFRALHPLYHTPPAPVHTVYSSIMPAPTLSTTTFHCPSPRLPPTSPVRMKKPNRGIGRGCGSTEAGAAPVLPTCTRLFSGRSWGTGDLRLNTCQLVVSVLSSPCHVGVSESGQNQKSQIKCI